LSNNNAGIEQIDANQQDGPAAKLDAHY
jgi:hypothetical protein